MLLGTMKLVWSQKNGNCYLALKHCTWYSCHLLLTTLSPVASYNQTHIWWVSHPYTSLSHVCLFPFYANMFVSFPYCLICPSTPSVSIVLNCVCLWIIMANHIMLIQPVVFLFFYLDEAKAAAAKLTTSPKLGCYSTHKECYWHWTKIEISYMFCFQNMTFPRVSYTFPTCRKFNFLFSVNSKCNSIIILFLNKLFIVVLLLLESFWYCKWNLIHIVACYSIAHLV